MVAVDISPVPGYHTPIPGMRQDAAVDILSLAPVISAPAGRQSLGRSARS